MSRHSDEQRHIPPVPDDELSLDAILAEYGRGGRQPAPAEGAPVLKITGENNLGSLAIIFE